jgi:hypothetical protein
LTRFGLDLQQSASCVGAEAFRGRSALLADHQVADLRAVEAGEQGDLVAGHS